MGTAIIKMREKGTNTVPDKFRKHISPRRTDKTSDKLSISINAGIESFVGFFIVGDNRQNSIKSFVVFESDNNDILFLYCCQEAGKEEQKNVGFS